MIARFKRWVCLRSLARIDAELAMAQDYENELCEAVSEAVNWREDPSPIYDELAEVRQKATALREERDYVESKLQSLSP